MAMADVTVRDVTAFLSRPNARMPTTQATATILKLCEIIRSHPGQALVYDAIKYFASKDLKVDAVSGVVELVLLALCQPNDRKDCSSTVNCHILAALGNLHSLLPENMTLLLKMWWKFVLNATVDSPIAVRKEACVLLATMKELLIHNKNKEVLHQFSNYIKLNLKEKMEALFNNKEEVYVLHLWKLLVIVLGKALHSGASFINALLRIPELAFRQKSESIKLVGYESWHVFIDNFAINPETINSVPRLKLLIQPFKFFIYYTKPLIEAQLSAWWHLAVVLGDFLHNHFELIVEPLLEICFGIGVQENGKAQPNRISGRLAATNGNQTMATTDLQRVKGFTSNQEVLMKFGIPILYRLLEEEDSKIESKLIEPLNSSLLSKKFLLYKHHHIIFKSLEVASTNSFGAQHRSAVIQMWTSLQAVVQKCASMENKMECMDFITTFFLTVKSIVESDNTNTGLGCEALQLAAACPSSILASSAFILNEKGSLHDTPSLLLLELLLSPHVVTKFVADKRFLPLLTTLVDWREKATRVPVLELFHYATRMLEKGVPHLSKSTASDAWIIVTQSLSASIEINKDVNQGDCLEHNYSCLYELLVFLFRHRLWPAVSADPGSKHIRKTWSTLLYQLIKYSGQPSDAQRQECLQQFLTLLKQVANEHVLEVAEMQVLLSVLQLILNHSLWPSDSKISSTNALPTSIIYLIVDLVVPTLDRYVSWFEGESTQLVGHEKAMSKCADTILSLIEDLLSDLSERDFVQVTLKLTPGVAQLLHLSAEQGNVFAEMTIFLKVNSLWCRIATEIPLHFKGPYDTELLTSLSPLFVMTFNHPKDCIRQKSRLLWNSTFATTYSKLIVPPALEEILRTVTPRLSNGEWSSSDRIESGSSSSSGEVVSLVVPSKIATPVSNTANYSRIRDQRNCMPAPPTPKLGTTLRSIPTSADLLDMNSQEFVVINSDPKPRQILTEHQKDVRAAKRIISAIPALYSDLTQDSVSLINEYSQLTPSLDIDVEPPAFSGMIDPGDQRSTSRVNDDSVRHVDTISDTDCVPNEQESAQTQVDVVPESIEHQVSTQNDDIVMITSEIPYFASEESQKNVRDDSQGGKVLKDSEIGEAADHPTKALTASKVVLLPDDFCDSAMDVSVTTIERNKEHTDGHQQFRTPPCSPSVTTFAGSARLVSETKISDGRRIGNETPKSSSTSASNIVPIRDRKSMTLRKHKIGVPVIIVQESVPSVSIPSVSPVDPAFVQANALFPVAVNLDADKKASSPEKVEFALSKSCNAPLVSEEGQNNALDGGPFKTVNLGRKSSKTVGADLTATDIGHSTIKVVPSKDVLLPAAMDVSQLIFMEPTSPQSTDELVETSTPKSKRLSRPKSNSVPAARGSSRMTLRKQKGKVTAAEKIKVSTFTISDPCLSAPVTDSSPPNTKVSGKRTLNRRPSEEEVFQKIRGVGRSIPKVRESLVSKPRKKIALTASESNSSNYGADSSPIVLDRICSVLVDKAACVPLLSEGDSSTTAAATTNSIGETVNDMTTITREETVATTNSIGETVNDMTTTTREETQTEISAANSSELLQEMAFTTVDLAAPMVVVEPQSTPASPIHYSSMIVDVTSTAAGDCTDNMPTNKCTEALSDISSSTSLELHQEMESKTSVYSPSPPNGASLDKDGAVPTSAENLSTDTASAGITSGGRKRKGSPLRKCSPTVKQKFKSNTTPVLVSDKKCKVACRPSELEVYEMARARRRSLKDSLTMEKNKPFNAKMIVSLSSQESETGVSHSLENDDRWQAGDTTVMKSLASVVNSNDPATASFTLNSRTGSPTGTTNFAMDAQNTSIQGEHFANSEVENATTSSEPEWSLAGCISQPIVESVPNCAEVKERRVDLDDTPPRIESPSISLSDDAMISGDQTSIEDVTSSEENVDSVFIDSNLKQASDEASEEIQQVGILISPESAGDSTSLVKEHAAVVLSSPEKVSVKVSSLSSPGCVPTDSPLKLCEVVDTCPLIVRQDPTISCAPMIEIVSDDDASNACPVLVQEICRAEPSTSSSSSLLQRMPLLSPVTFSPDRDSERATTESITLALTQLNSPCGVLKKHKTREFGGFGSPSSYSKKRKVSFADPPAYDENNVPYQSNPRFRFERGGRFNRRLQMNGSPKLRTSIMRTYGGKKSDRNSSSQNIQEPEQSLEFSESNTQGSYESPSIAQVDCTDPIFPNLLECKDPIGVILPRLTSSLWTRGLNNMLQSRNIKTIGDLCAMTEGDVQSLPIKSPKVMVVRQSLTQYLNNSIKASPSTSPQTGGVSSHSKRIGAGIAFSDVADPSELPRLEDEMATWSPEKAEASSNKSATEEPSTSRRGDGEKSVDIALRMDNLLNTIDNIFGSLQQEDYQNMPLELILKVHNKMVQSSLGAVNAWNSANGK